MSHVTCKTCDRGSIHQKKKYRMSGMVVFIGYVFLIPSLLGLAFSALLIVSTGRAGGEVSAIMEEPTRSTLEDAQVPEDIIVKVLDFDGLTDAERESLTSRQRSAVTAAQLGLAAGTVGAGAGVAVAGAIAVALGVASLVGGLLGWLLTMRKKVLQCDNCGAVVPAS